MTLSKYVWLVVLGLMMVASTTNLFAAPLGGHAVPLEARNYQCTDVTLAPGQSQTIAVPYTSTQYYLKLLLEGSGADKVNMQVFTSEQNKNGTGPVGLGTYNLFEPMHSKTWEGRFLAPDTIYVRLTNTNTFAVTVKLCSYEHPWAPPPTPLPLITTPVPPPTPDPGDECEAMGGTWLCDMLNGEVVCECVFEGEALRGR